MCCKNSDTTCWVDTLKCTLIIQCSNIHSTSQKYSVNKPVLGGNICRWILLFQEFDFEVVLKPGRLNVRPDHLLRIKSGKEPKKLEDNFLDAKLFAINVYDNQYQDIIHLLSIGYAPEGFTTAQKKHFFVKATDFTLITR